jgi:adenylate cyclase
MTSPRTLSVILAADAVGYSRLSEKDEAAALAAVTWFRERAAEIVGAHHGRIFFRAGDGVMAELPNVRAGVLTALELAETVRARVAHGDRAALPVRIGLHLGDVSHEHDGDALGHDVNVAARIQQLAEPGEVLVSRAIADTARGKVDARFERVGRERAKNIVEPIELFRVAAGASRPRLALIAGGAVVATLAAVVAGLILVRGLDTGETARDLGPGVVATTASIAVLPFVNMSSDEEQEYFSDGLSEELLNRLAQVEGLRVIARTSSFAFKDQNTDVRTIASTLGVAHVLEGSVRKSGDQLRITAQLVDASDGAHLWSRTYDRRLDDVFAIQDEIAAAVADQLSAALGVAPRAPDYGGTTSFEAYDHVLRGRAQLALATPDAYLAASEEFRRALAVDPTYGQGWAELAIVLSTYLTFARGYAPNGLEPLIAEREAATARALELTPDLSRALVAKMWLHADRREWVAAEQARMAVLAAMTDPTACLECGGVLTLAGRVSAGLPYREAARRNDPLSMTVAQNIARHYAYLGMGEALAREYERAQGLSGGRWGLENAMLLQLMHDDASSEAMAERLARVCPEPGAPFYCPALTEASRSPEQAGAILRGLLDGLRERTPSAAIDVALWAAYFGDRELALDALEAFAPAAPSATLQYLWTPILSEIRAEPRFEAIIRDIGFDELWRATGLWADYCRPLGPDDFECF